MKILYTILISCLLFVTAGWAQQGFNFENYQAFLSSHENLSTQSLLEEFSLSNVYSKDPAAHQSVQTAAFMDSMLEKYNLTADELALLQENHFVVTERLSFNSPGDALHNVYNYDLPVFVSSDAILYALHESYDRILMDLEIDLLKPDLEQLLTELYAQVPALVNDHNSPELQEALADVDLYVTMALSLLQEKKVATQTGLVKNFDTVWDAIEAEQSASLPLFSERNRKIDFSQFTPRGHYTKVYWENGEQVTLSNYFQAMMWLGRIDFWLTPPPENPWEAPWKWDEIQRMARAALLMNDLLDISNASPIMQDMDKIITFFVGESDNLTPTQLAQVITDNNISLASIADSSGLAGLQNILKSSDEYGQKILSGLIMMDPFSNEPGVLPVSYKLMGQRFIIDSYVMGNVVYDRIVYNDAKIWRPMPDPMDAMFVLGNDNTLPLLKDELDTYHYTQNLAGMRYLVDSYDDSFWEMSLYNSWLNAIRTLNPTQALSALPMFLQSPGWQQKQLNTQLASWAQLRHDNLLYAKQSYTGMTGCSFPHSYVEPYPEFYKAIQDFADQSLVFFADYPQDTQIMMSIMDYYSRLKSTVAKLEALAVKELNSETFSEQDTTFLKSMLFLGAGSGAPPYTGWYADLFFEREDAALVDHVIADVHTQPTDEAGNEVGRVLHVGVGKFNLGFFAIPSPSDHYIPMIYAGPVMSYYEKTTENYERLTDEEWKNMVIDDQVPARPDWVNIYLADAQGNRMPAGRELPYQIVTDVQGNNGSTPQVFALSDNYPNPFNPVTTIDYVLPDNGMVELSVYDITGRKVAELVNGHRNAGSHRVTWDAGNMASGVYFYRLRAESQQIIKKMTLLK